MLTKYNYITARDVLSEIKDVSKKNKIRFITVFPYLILLYLVFFSGVPVVYTETREYMIDIPDTEEVVEPTKPSYKKGDVRNLINTDPDSKWDLFRVRMYNLALELNKEYKFPLETIDLYDYLMKTTFAESKFKGNAKNKLSSARGGWQYMYNTRVKLGIPHDIDKIALHDQIKYKKKYFRYKMRSQKIDPSKIDEFIDIYCVIFSPGNADKPSSKVLIKSCKFSKKGCKVKKNKKYYCSYHANRGYDSNKDGKIVKKEIGEYILNKHYK